MPYLALRTVVCAAALLVAAAAPGVRAQDAQPAGPAPAAEAAAPAPSAPVDPDAVAAKVGDQTVTEGEIVVAREAFGEELANVPPDQQRSVLIDALVNMELMALAAKDDGLGEGPEFERQLEFLRTQALRNLYVEKVIIAGLTDEEVQAGYQEMVVASFKPEEQVHARHILVDTEEEAKKIIADLAGGAAFEELAKQSKDPSGQNGGDLGFFGRGQMVPPFEEAAFKIAPGTVGEAPVQSEFGWHVIKVEEKRMSEAPPLAEVEGQLRQMLLRKKFETVIAELRAKYPVEVVGGTATPEAPAAGDAPAAGETPPAPPAAAPAAPATPEGEAAPN